MALGPAIRGSGIGQSHATFTAQRARFCVTSILDISYTVTYEHTHMLRIREHEDKPKRVYRSTLGRPEQHAPSET